MRRTILPCFDYAASKTCCDARTKDVQAGWWLCLHKFLAHETTRAVQTYRAYRNCGSVHGNDRWESCRNSAKSNTVMKFTKLRASMHEKLGRFASLSVGFCTKRVKSRRVTCPFSGAIVVITGKRHSRSKKDSLVTSMLTVGTYVPRQAPSGALAGCFRFLGAPDRARRKDRYLKFYNQRY